jgi:hypothetical protein
LSTFTSHGSEAWKKSFLQDGTERTRRGTDRNRGERNGTTYLDQLLAFLCTHDATVDAAEPEVASDDLDLHPSPGVMARVFITRLLRNSSVETFKNSLLEEKDEFLFRI